MATVPTWLGNCRRTRRVASSSHVSPLNVHYDTQDANYPAAKAQCPICNLPLQQSPQSLILLFLCRHVVHAGCASGGDDLPSQPDPILVSVGISGPAERGLSGKIALSVFFSSSQTTVCSQLIEVRRWFVPRSIKDAQSAIRRAKASGHDTFSLHSCLFSINTHGDTYPYHHSHLFFYLFRNCTKYTCIC
jgi:hypothetical protein